MLGAIIGDIVGSAYEFDPTNDYDFELFKDGCDFTDDTICTVAVADALLNHKDYGTTIHEWCRKYGGSGLPVYPPHCKDRVYNQHYQQFRLRNH